MDVRSASGEISVAGLLFAEDFDSEPAAALVEVPSACEVMQPTFSAADLDAARQTARNEGRAAAMAEREKAHQAAAAQALAGIAAQLEATREEMRLQAEQLAQSLAHLLLDTLITMLPTLCGRYGEGEVRAIVRSVLPALVTEPAVIVRVNPSITNAVQAEIDRLSPDLASRVQLLPTNDVRAGDVRISWEAGAAVRDTGALWKEIAAILAETGLLMPCEEKEAALVG